MIIARGAAGRGKAIRGWCQVVVLSVLPLAVCLLSAARASAQTLFGPQQYTLTGPSPQTFSTGVSTTAGPAHLHVVNGASDGTARLTHASLTLNGIEVVSPEDLGADVALVDKPVFLFANNVLSVTLTGPVGGTLTVTLERRSSTLTSVTPASGRQGETLPVAIVGSDTHFAQGTTLLWAGRGVSVGGAPPGEFGPVTVQDGTHLTATLTLGPTIVLGPRLLLAKTNGERAVLFPGVTVLAGTPALPGTTVSTLAGTGTPGLVDGAGTSAQFRFPADVAARADGSAVVADTANSRLRALAPDGTTTTVSLPVSLLLPTGVTLDAAGRTVIADTARCVIRIVNPNGTVTTIGSAFACTFADGPAGTARFRFPRDVVADAAGTLYVADAGNHRVRKIDPQGNVTTLAGTGTFGGTDGPATSATFGLLTGIAVAEQPTGPPIVLVSDAVFHRLRQIAPDGTVSPLAGTGLPGFADGPAASAQLAFPTRLTRDPAGHLYFADTLNNLIRRLTPQGTVETLAGTGAWGSQDGPGASATFTLPVGVGLAAGAPTTVFVADTFNHKLRLIQVGAPPTISALDPTSAVQGDTLSLTVTGSNLTGATALTFLLDGSPDPNVTATNLSVNLEGTQLTATVSLALTALPGPRTVTVTTPGGTSDATPSPATTFTVLGRLTLIPTFQQLTQGSNGGLTVEITTPPPPGGLEITLTSGNPAVATLPPTVTIPEGATTILTPVSAVGEGSTTLSAEAAGYAPASAAVTVVLPPPTLTSFSPTSGPVGTAVTITGGSFSTVNPTGNTVTFTGPDSTRIPAPVTGVTSTQLTTTVPAGAVTGPLQVTTPGGSATSTGHFVVLPSPDFTLAVEPLTVPAVQGMTVAIRVRALATGGYTGLTQLSTGPLPPGVTATFTPSRLAPDASGLLTLTTTDATPQGLRPIEVRGTAAIGGSPVTRTGTTTLDVQGPGQTLLSGQVRDGEDAPLAGVRITLGGSTPSPLGTTDAAGNFLVAVPVAGAQVFLVDGSPLNTTTVTFPTIPVTVTIQPGVVTPLGFTPRLQAQPVARLVPITAGQATVLAPPDLPGFTMTIPAGVSVIGWDNVANTQVSVQAVSLDRSPLPAPPAGLTARQVYLFSFGKVGGGTPTGPIPIDTPNDLDALPGEQVDLYYFNEAPDGSAPNRWDKYGTGTVSPDGSRIVTDVNPATGQPYGIPRFCCGGRMNVLPLTVRPGGGPSGGPGDGGTFAGEPVDVATGFFYLTKTDLVLPGILPLAITRTYRTLISDATLFGMPVSGGPFGDGTSWTYDVFLVPPPGGSADALLLVHPGNRQDRFARQADGAFTNSSSPALRGATVTVDPTGRTLRFKDGATWRFDLTGRLLTQSDRTGNTVTLTRDSQGRITAITDPTGRQITVSYTGAGLRIESLRDPLGREVRYTYESGRLSTVIDPAGGVTRYTYDAGNRLLTITDPRGILFLTNEYDQGRVVKQTQADGGIWTFAYTATGGFVSQTIVTDPRGNATTSRFNSSGYLVSQTDALGQSTTLTRAPGSNLVLSTTDPLGRVSRFTYDAQGNMTSLTDPQGQTRTLTYEPTFNKVTAITDPLGNLTTFEYDAEGNLVAITDPEQNQRPEADRLKTRITYNPSGQPLTTTDPLGNTTTFAYDAVGNLAQITDPLGHTTTRTYDGASRLLTQTDPRGPLTRFAYDALNRLTALTDPLGGLTQFTYDGNGNLLTVTDARESVTTHEYDSMDRLSTRTDPLTRSESFTYDGVGNLVSTTDRKSQTTTFTYDAVNRRTQATYADGAVATFIFDAAGRLTLADDTADPHRPIEMAYDALDRLLAETTSLGTVTYQYDRAGRRTQMTVAGQAPVAYAYDAASRLTQLVQEPLAPVTLQYDAASRRSLLTLPNGVSTEYQYDAAARLTALIYRNATGLLGDLTYRYDPAGNRIAVGGSFARTLLPDSAPSASYDAANEQLGFGDKTMAFDANGNVASLTDPTDSTTFTWDARNRLTALSGPGLAGTFAYDAQGRRARRGIGDELREYQYDGVDIVRERVSGEEVGYLRTLGIDEALGRIAPDGTAYYLADALSSTAALTDPGGTLAITYNYEPFGRTVLAGGSSVNPFQFTGREHDSALLYYYRARYYQPGLGRFISEDPIEFRGGDFNLYTYVSNGPTNRSDPTGLTGAACAGTAIFQLGGDSLAGRKDGFIPNLGWENEWTQAAHDLNNCLNACAAGGAAWRNFCRGLPPGPVRGACWGLELASETACRGWCFLHWGK